MQSCFECECVFNQHKQRCVLQLALRLSSLHTVLRAVRCFLYIWPVTASCFVIFPNAHLSHFTYSVPDGGRLGCLQLLDITNKSDVTNSSPDSYVNSPSASLGEGGISRAAAGPGSPPSATT